MKNCYAPICGAVVLCACLNLFAQDYALTDGQIRHVLRDAVENQKRAFGIVAGVVDGEGSRVVSYGTFDRDSTNAVGGNTVFEIGSVTKVFTALLLARAVESSGASLDDPAAKFLPDSVKLPSRGGREITLRHLATHTSGLPRLPDNFSPSDPHNPYADYTVEQLYEFLNGCKLNAAPGEKYEYSNLGAGLLGHILARQAKTNYEALAIRKICAPLGMNDTRITLSPAMQKRFAPGHNQAGVQTKNWDLPTLAGAGALRSTVNDLLTLLAANLFLKSSALSNAMATSHVSQPTSAGTGTEMGLGWHVRRNSGARYLWHNGGTGGYHAFVAFDAEKECGVAVLADSANDIDDIGWHLLSPRFKINEVRAKQPAKIDYRVYDDYVGNYRFFFGGEFVITREGDRLLAKLDKQPAFEVYPESETKFFYTVVDAQLTFVRDDKGEVSHLILHQNGLDQKATKLK